MTAYEFTRLENDFTRGVSACLGYDVRVIESLIVQRSAYDLRMTEDYERCYDMFIELTMSGNKTEAIQWSRYWMANAIAYGQKTRNLDWRTKFLAAYDLLNNLLRKEN